MPHEIRTPSHPNQSHQSPLSQISMEEIIIIFPSRHQWTCWTMPRTMTHCIPSCMYNGDYFSRNCPVTKVRAVTTELIATICRGRQPERPVICRRAIEYSYNYLYGICHVGNIIYVILTAGRNVLLSSHWFYFFRYLCPLLMTSLDIYFWSYVLFWVWNCHSFPGPQLGES